MQKYKPVEYKRPEAFNVNLELFSTCLMSYCKSSLLWAGWTTFYQRLSFFGLLMCRNLNPKTDNFKFKSKFLSFILFGFSFLNDSVVGGVDRRSSYNWVLPKASPTLSSRRIYIPNFWLRRYRVYHWFGIVFGA